ncbi:MAG: hypothetical protein A2831_00505 [Candidatus Yanofskybacteria bacterium RIFCSPHIGHO2_01_FULL_44_17]|uniref:Elp3/MiaA/NifB-like radical SAM core domain-containing protein n=1 Tax=Candidatus Yanofskybacteria bacterium RIFCSPHIGHO2_01_FULL_44_17 TaxID=1802668 RepID=A0A1F8EXR0_9BACT|nr:MAG: hypothetical protein A2831_00505 [Candidatus Yanofskybacteria bacterium RIFCSPHIGHO2_01_FULL_44_17]
MATLPILQPVHTKKPPHPADIIKDISYKDVAGLNVVFINMPLRETAVPNTTPEGPLLMATRLRKHYDLPARVIDFNGYRIKDALAEKRGLPNGRHFSEREVYRFLVEHFSYYGTPDLVAFSGKITTLRWQETIAKMVRQILPHVFLVSGGGLATELKIGLFNYIPELDAVAHSEGDDTIIKICQDAKTIKEKGLRRAIESGSLNPYYLGEISNKPRLMYEGNRPRDLDALPYADIDILSDNDIIFKRVFGCDYKLVPSYLASAVWGVSANNSSAAPFTMTRSTTSVSSRGCPYGCKYCYRGTQGERQWAVRSAQHIHNQLVHYKERYGIDFHGFPDDNFAVTYGRIQDLVPLLGPLGIKWGTHTRLDEAAGLKPRPNRPGEYFFEDPLRVALMAKSGCTYIGAGPESACAKTIETLGKGGFTLSNGFEATKVFGKMYQFPRSMKYGIKNCQDVDIHVNCTWIKGNPNETLEDLKETVAFMAWQEQFYAPYGVRPEAVNKKMFTLTWYPGTEIIHHPKVRHELTRIFGLSFDPMTHEPLCNEAFHQYCLALDDATKVLEGPDGEPLNFSDIPNETFLKIRGLVDTGKTLEILNL